MEGFLQTAGAVLIALLLCQTVGSQNKSFAGLLGMLVCTMVLLGALRYLEPVSDFLQELEKLGNLPGETVTILLKTALIGILTEMSALLCADSGNNSLGQSLRLAGSAVILWLALPLFRALLDLVQRILEGI